MVATGTHMSWQSVIKGHNVSHCRRRTHVDTMLFAQREIDAMDLRVRANLDRAMEMDPEYVQRQIDRLEAELGRRMMAATDRARALSDAPINQV